MLLVESYELISSSMKKTNTHSFIIIPQKEISFNNEIGENL